MKRVDPKVYTRDYYLNDCSGYVDFKKSNGNILEPRLKEMAKFIKIEKNTKILDVGCGRGEMVIYCAKKGAESIGIDYSNDAIKLAKEYSSKQSNNIQKLISFKQMDAKKLNFKDSYFDYVILTDVVEHLYDWELDLAIKEIKRVLKSDGILIMHTAPNKNFNDYAYKYYCYPVGTLIIKIWNLILKKNYPNIQHPSELRTDSHRIMHINEPTYNSLKNLFKKYNFIGSIYSSNITAVKPSLGIQDRIFNSVVFFNPLSKYYPLNILFGSDFVSVLKNKK